MCAKNAPVARLVVHANFERVKFCFSLDDGEEKAIEFVEIVGMDAFAEGFGHVFLDGHSKNIEDARADESVAPIGIHDENYVGKAVDETPRELLLFVQATLDF